MAHGEIKANLYIRLVLKAKYNVQSAAKLFNNRRFNDHPIGRETRL